MLLSLQAAARDAGDTIALIAGDRRFTWRELESLALREAAQLRSFGFGRRVAAMTARADPDTVIRLLALFEMGVPAWLLPPRLAEVDKARLCRKTRACERIDQVPRADPTGLLAESEEIPDDERALVILQSSGSSGPPKSIVLSRRAVARSAEASAAQLGSRADDRWLACMPLAHVGGLSILTRCLAARGSLVLMPRFDQEELALLLERERVTLLSLVPTMLHRLLDLPKWKAPGSLRAVLLGGAPARRSLVERARRQGVPVLTTYGLTEAASQVATQGPQDDRPLGETAAPPLPGCELRIREGLVEIRSATLASGYFPEDSPPLLGRDGWLRTRDLGRLDSAGRLEIFGRADDVIISGGEKVNPLEVEAFLEGLPALDEALVFGVPDETWGQRVAALIVPRADASFTLEELGPALREGLPPPMRPRLAALTGELPRKDNGKRDRSAAAELWTTQLRDVPGAGGDS